MTSGSRWLHFAKFLLSLFILQFKIGILLIILPCCTCYLSIPHSIHSGVTTGLFFNLHIYSLEAFVYEADFNERDRRSFCSVTNNFRLTPNKSYHLGYFFFGQFTSHRGRLSHWLLSYLSPNSDFLLYPSFTSDSIMCNILVLIPWVSLGLVFACLDSCRYMLREKTGLPPSEATLLTRQSWL